MGLLSSNLEFIRTEEQRVQNELGKSIEIKYLSSRVPCATCKLDPAYNQSNDPNCPECGGSYWKNVITTYTKQGVVRYITELEIQKLEAGSLQIGDCRIRFDKDNYDILKNTMVNQQLIKIVETEEEYRVADITLSTLQTSFIAYCRKKSNES